MLRKDFPFYVLMGVCLVLWGILSAPYLFWFFRFLPLHFDLLHGLVAMGVIGLSVYKLKSRKQWTPNRSMLPLAVFLCLIGLAGIFFIRTQASIRIFGFSASLILLYGLLCPLMDARTWKQGLFPFVLLLMSLPFGRHFDVFVGYPLRMEMVKLVSGSLQPFFPGLETYSGILVLENRASFVDMDCSGLKGLWVSWLLFLALSWMEGIGNKKTWLAGFTLFSLWILTGNFIRIFILVLIHTVWDKPELDPLIHQSIALFFLLSACYFAFLWLRARKKPNPETAYTTKPMSAFPALLSACCVMLVLCFTPVYASRQSEQQDLSAFIHRMEERGWQATPLSASESEVFSREAVQSLKFEKANLELILVFDGDWNSQHKPELCYESAGIRLKDFRTRILPGGLSVREIEFDKQKARAFYWFQQGDHCISDFGEKVWTQIRGGDQKWTMISILDKNGELPLKEIRTLNELVKNLTHD